jgi:hypothetical protein
MGSSTDSDAIFDSVCDWSSAIVVPIVLPGDGASSLLNRKPRGLDGHGGGIRGDQNLWNAIRDWINDGAYFTTADRAVGAQQKCTPPP